MNKWKSLIQHLYGKKLSDLMNCLVDDSRYFMIEIIRFIMKYDQNIYTYSVTGWHKVNISLNVVKRCIAWLALYSSLLLHFDHLQLKTWLHFPKQVKIKPVEIWKCTPTLKHIIYKISLYVVHNPRVWPHKAKITNWSAKTKQLKIKQFGIVSGPALIRWIFHSAQQLSKFVWTHRPR